MRPACGQAADRERDGARIGTAPPLRYPDGVVAVATPRFDRCWCLLHGWCGACVDHRGSSPRRNVPARRRTRMVSPPSVGRYRRRTREAGLQLRIAVGELVEAVDIGQPTVSYGSCGAAGAATRRRHAPALGVLGSVVAWGRLWLARRAVLGRVSGVLRELAGRDGGDGRDASTDQDLLHSVPPFHPRSCAVGRRRPVPRYTRRQLARRERLGGPKQGSLDPGSPG